MCVNQGSAVAIEKAIEAQTVSTAVTNSGVEISGRFTRVVKDTVGNAAYLQCTGPTRLAYQGVELDGHGIARHPDGFGSPVGRLQAMERCLSSYGIDELVQHGIEIGKPVKLEFRSGVTVGGSLTAIIRRDQKNLVFSFEQCTVTAHDGELLFDPAWGVYDMAVGDSVVSLTGH
jgi:phenylalanine-4-hydroxylase